MTGVSASLASLTPITPAGRVARRPSHSFQLRHRPWQIQPFMIAPALPGETLKNVLLQSRCTTDALASSMTGWWLEYYIFFVKLRDLDGRDDFAEMVMNPTFDLSAYDRAATAVTYHAGPGIDWTFECLKRVTEEYFRDEGETWDTAVLDGLPLAGINNSSWMDSIKLDAATQATDHELPGENPVLPAHMAGWENHFAQWEHMKALRLTEATFEDWLRSFGVRAPKAEAETHRPELVRYIRDWALPFDGADLTGSPASLCRWNISERADKDRYFPEPGFLFGVTVARPKVYLAGQLGSAISMLNDAFAFMPAVMANEPYTSLRKFDAGESTADGPFGDTPSDDYWVDIRDLYLYGDQFANFDLAAASDAGAVALPGSDLAIRFATSAMADAQFSGADKLVRQEGVASLNILGRQVDHT